MAFVAIGVAGGVALAGVAGSAISANAAENAADVQAQSTRDASQTQLQANRESIAFQQAALDRQREDLAPYRTAGSTAIGQLSAGTQPGGQFAMGPPVPQYTPFGVEAFQQDPSYLFRVTEGQKAIERSAAARGTLLSGRSLKEVQRYGQDAASQEYQAAYGRHTNDFSQKLQEFNAQNVNQSNQFNRLASVAGTGQTSAQQLATATGNTAANIGASTIATGNQVGSNLINAGNARASGYAGQASAFNSGLSTIGGAGNSFAQYRLLSSLLNSGSSINPATGASFVDPAIANPNFWQE